MKIMTCFIDTSAWLAIILEQNENHRRAVDYFNQILKKNVKIVSNNLVLDETIDILRTQYGRELAEKFSNIIDESILTIHLRMDWITRRQRRYAINNFLKSRNMESKLRHFVISETIKKKRADVIFSFDPAWKMFDIPIGPGD